VSHSIAARLNVAYCRNATVPKMYKALFASRGRCPPMECIILQNTDRTVSYPLTIDLIVLSTPYSLLQPWESEESRRKETRRRVKPRLPRASRLPQLMDVARVRHLQTNARPKLDKLGPMSKTSCLQSTCCSHRGGTFVFVMQVER
jgi:hypothetical protein